MCIIGIMPIILSQLLALQMISAVLTTWLFKMLKGVILASPGRSSWIFVLMPFQIRRSPNVKDLYAAQKLLFKN